MYQDQMVWLIEAQSQFPVFEKLAVHIFQFVYVVGDGTRVQCIFHGDKITVVDLFAQHDRSERPSIPLPGQRVQVLDVDQTLNQHLVSATSTLRPLKTLIRTKLGTNGRRYARTTLYTFNN